MIYDYPPLKENEWLFGYLLRYHAYTGNVKFKFTIQDWYDNDSPISYHFIPLSCNIKNIVPNYDTYISHTIYPYIQTFSYHSLIAIDTKNFMTNGVDRTREILDRVGAFPILNTIKYCPMCMKDDYGMFYSEHQIMEVQTCTRHGCYLKRVNISRNDFYNIGLLLRKIDFYISYPKNSEIYMYVAKQGAYLLKHGTIFTRYKMINIIQRTMLEKGMAIQKSKLIESLVEDEYAKFISQYNEYFNELKNTFINFRLQHIISLSPKASIYFCCPMEYLMAVKFLYGDFEKFYEIFRDDIYN